MVDWRRLCGQSQQSCRPCPPFSSAEISCAQLVARTDPRGISGITPRRATGSHQVVMEANGLPLSEPRTAGLQPSSRSRREHVPPPWTAAGQLVGVKHQPHALVAQHPYPSGSALRSVAATVRPPLSGRLLAGRHRPPAAHRTAHSPAHRSASNCQVRSRFFLTCSAASGATPSGQGVALGGEVLGVGG